MKNSFFLLLPLTLSLIVFQSCSEDELEISTYGDSNFTCLVSDETDVITNDCFDDWSCGFKVKSQSKVDIKEDFGLVSGDKNVFQMISDREDDPELADDQDTKILVFELDELQDNFSVEDKQLKDMQVHYKRICRCSGIMFYEVTSGCLQGEKQSDGSWLIQGNLIISLSFGDVDLKFDARFVN